MSDEQNDYSEIFTPTTEDVSSEDPRTVWADGGGCGGSRYSEMTSAMSGISGRYPVSGTVLPSDCTMLRMFVKG
jgi:hypothetical protein